MQVDWWVWLIIGIAFLFMVLLFVMIGKGLRDLHKQRGDNKFKKQVH